jgi:hypothetical protein
MRSKIEEENLGGSGETSQDKGLENNVVYITIIPKLNSGALVCNKISKLPGISSSSIVLLADGNSIMAKTNEGDQNFINNLILRVSRVKGIEGMDVLPSNGYNGSGIGRDKIIRELSEKMGCPIMRL